MENSSVNGRVLAKVLCLSAGRVSQLTLAGVLTRRAGGYRLLESVQSYILFLLRGDPFDSDPVVEKARLCRVKRLTLECELVELKSHYVETADFEAEMRLFAESIKNSLVTLPERLQREAGLNSNQVSHVKHSIDQLCNAVTAE